MGFYSNQLPILGEAIAGPNSLEMVRAWVANRHLHCALLVGTWDDTDLDERDGWGMLLADIAKHAADALAASGLQKGETINRIRQRFNSELDHPTSSAAGDFVDEPSRN
jgi:hypothetical protein